MKFLSPSCKFYLMWGWVEGVINLTVTCLLHVYRIDIFASALLKLRRWNYGKLI